MIFNFRKLKHCTVSRLKFTSLDILQLLGIRMNFLYENSFRVASQLASVVSLPNSIKIKEEPDQSSCSELMFVNTLWHHEKSCVILRRN